MSITNKEALYLGVPGLIPDKIVARFTGTFTTTTSLSTGFGATYDGVHSITNTYGAKALPISRFTTTGGAPFYHDFEQNNNVIVVTAVTDSQIKYRWAANASPFTVTYSTVLLSLD